MRLFIVGPLWVGDWTEGVERAASLLGHKTTLFYYWRDNWNDNSIYLKERAKSYLHPLIKQALRLTNIGLKNLQAKLKDVIMNRRLIGAVQAFHPDVILILKGETISYESLLTLKALNVPLVSWWVDSPFSSPMPIKYFEFFDMVYMFDKECITDLAAQGIKHVMYLPCACDQTTYFPQSLSPSDYPGLNCTIGFIATYYPERTALLRQMKGLDIGLWGDGWDAANELNELPYGSWRGRRITADDAAKVYNLAKICPNVHHSQTRFGGLNTRTFEIPAAGGFELVDNVPGLEENFDIGREIIAYSSPDEFHELTEHYLSHPSDRTAVIERGHARVMQDHTYKQRLEVILGTLDC
jgi:spore maturation protein CgeB